MHWKQWTTYKQPTDAWYSGVGPSSTCTYVCSTVGLVNSVFLYLQIVAPSIFIPKPDIFKIILYTFSYTFSYTKHSQSSCLKTFTKYFQNTGRFQLQIIFKIVLINYKYNYNKTDKQTNKK